MVECNFCKNEAKYRIDGFAEDGDGEGYVYSLACEEHKLEFEKWGSLADSDTYLHDYVYYDSITELSQEVTNGR